MVKSGLHLFPPKDQNYWTASLRPFLVIGGFDEVLQVSLDFLGSPSKSKDVRQGWTGQGGAMADKQVKRPSRSVIGGSQPDLFGGKPSRTPGKVLRRRKVGFQDPDPHEIFIGDTRLDRFLESMDLGWVLTIREALRELDWSSFEERYTLTGRSPYAPASMMGLVVYGPMSGTGSLRELDRLARLNVGAMWICGGICPDHASIGRFIQLHEETLSTSFFEQLTHNVLKRLSSKTRVLAGDGTIVEAAASRYRTIKVDAARQAAEEAQAKAETSPEDDELNDQADHARKVADAAEARADARRKNGQKAATTRVSTTDPEAPILQTKDGRQRPGYTPSVLSNEDRVIVGQHVEPTDELSSFTPMLDQADRISGDVETVLLDGKYACGRMVKTAVERELDLLCPPSQSDSNDENGQFTKQDFGYDEDKDCYYCPAGARLTRRGRGEDRRRGTCYTTYSLPVGICRKCQQKGRCFKKKPSRGRRIQRYDTDEPMEALRLVMQQPNARAALAQRKTMVEPVFSEMKGAQRLTRFRRFGLKGVRTEFAIHACAYNLRRLVAAVLAALFARILAILMGLRELNCQKSNFASLNG
jgi:transposase